MDPFRIDVADDVLDDLRGRLARTRFAIPTPGSPWAAGTHPPFLAELVSYWGDSFDWRSREALLNQFPQFTTGIDGTRVHFVHVRTGSEELPIILTHGWPYSFIEMLTLVPRLTEGPSARDVIVPSLPGFGFSESMSQPFTPRRVAHLWHLLMTEVLGYDRFLTYGEDVGAEVSDWLAALHPGAVAGLHATHAAFPPPERREHLMTAETEFVERLSARWARESAYSALQSTKPDTLAAALIDSPSGLLAWLVEKFHTWSHLEGDLEEVWTRDDILTTATLYWVTESIGSSFRPYYEGDGESLPMIDVPVGVSVQKGESGFPRSYAERTYRDIRFWNDLPRGGHFTAKQTPELVAADIARFVDLL